MVRTSNKRRRFGQLGPFLELPGFSCPEKLETRDFHHRSRHFTVMAAAILILNSHSIIEKKNSCSDFKFVLLKTATMIYAVLGLDP
jgi:hypothetical protein